MEFAGIGAHINSPVRTYSSGMMARLAFSVAISVDADILLFDQVLAVSDAHFQKRCAQRIDELHAQGTTVLYVSHDLSTVRRLCDVVHVLQRGEIVRSGAPDEVVPEYKEYNLAGKLLPVD